MLVPVSHNPCNREACAVQNKTPVAHFLYHTFLTQKTIQEKPELYRK
jgi:hypothetical protein